MITAWMMTPPTCTGIPDPANPGGFIIDPNCSGNGPSLASQLLNDTIFGPFVHSASDWLSQVLVNAMTFFTAMPIPDLGNADATSLSPSVGFLRSHTAYIASALLVLSVIIGMIRMAVSREAREGMKVGVSIARYLITVTLSAAVTVMLLAAGNAYATWIINEATNNAGIGNNFFHLFEGGGILSALGYLVMLIIAALFAGLLFVTMVFRAAVLPVIIGAGLPLFAAASGTEGGKKGFDQLCAWVLAFALVEPAVATILATGFTLLSQDPNTTGWMPFIQGLVLLMATCLVLPALLRILVPAAGQMAGGRGLGSAALGAAATVVGLAAFGAGGKALSAVGTGSPAGPMPSSGGGAAANGSPGGPSSPPPSGGPSGPSGSPPPPTPGPTPPPSTPPATPPAPPVSTWKPAPATP